MNVTRSHGINKFTPPVEDAKNDIPFPECILHIFRRCGSLSMILPRELSKFLFCVARFEVLMAVKIQVEFFWVVTPCNVVEYQCFRGPCCLHLLGCDAR
jgi:hypothetical protein